MEMESIIPNSANSEKVVVLKFNQQFESIFREWSESAIFYQSVAVMYPNDKPTSQFWNTRAFSNWTLGVGIPSDSSTTTF